jgi:3'-phosphoadenosine 5'-phosphosulfate sulfotransferase (PAPS reductase)/FAD synthetase
VIYTAYIQDVDLKLKDWAFSQRKNLPWEAKLNLTETRIIDWANHWNGLVYVSFSGGLDSTVLLHFVRKILGNDVPAVFVDTGLEFPEIKEFVKKFDNVDTLSPDMSYRQVIRKFGYPLVSKETATKIRKLRHGKLSDRHRNYLLHGDERGKIGKLPECWKFLITAPFNTSDKCCDVMKKHPFTKYVRETGRHPFTGETQDEGFMRKRTYEKTGCNVFSGRSIKSKPMGFWTKQDTMRYIVENNLEICSVYGKIVCENGVYRTTGEQRTGCIFCGFGAHMENYPNRYQRLQRSHNKLWEHCMKDFDKGGLGFANVLDYINVPYLDNVEAVGDHEHGYQQYKII